MDPMYAVGAVIKELKITALGQEQIIQVSDFADGMVGFVPVFATAEAATAWSPDRPLIRLDPQ